MKSLPPQTLINLAVFGTLVQPLFPESRPCSDVSVVQGFWGSYIEVSAQCVPACAFSLQDAVQLICESIETLKIPSGPPDVLAALDWAMGQPQHRAYPRQLFLLTAASPMAATTHRTLELMRWHRGTARYGMGRARCLRLSPHKGLPKITAASFPSSDASPLGWGPPATSCSRVYLPSAGARPTS